MNIIKKAVSFVYRFTEIAFLCVVHIISRGLRKIIKAIISLWNFLIERKWKIFFVIILPIIGNYLLVTYVERRVCRFELPVTAHQDDLIVCSKAMSSVDPLSRISPDLANLLRYDLSIKNNWRAVNTPENTTTSTLIFLIKDKKTGEEKKGASWRV